MASGVVNSAILSVQQARLDAHESIAVEIDTIKSNIVSTHAAARQEVYSLRTEILSLKKDQIDNKDNASVVAQDQAAIKADQALIKQVPGQEKEAVRREQAEIRALNGLDHDSSRNASATIKQLLRGRLDPIDVPSLIDTTNTNVQVKIGRISNVAEGYYQGALGFFSNNLQGRASS